MTYTAAASARLRMQKQAHCAKRGSIRAGVCCWGRERALAFLGGFSPTPEPPGGKAARSLQGGRAHGLLPSCVYDAGTTTQGAAVHSVCMRARTHAGRTLSACIQPHPSSQCPPQDAGTGPPRDNMLCGIGFGSLPLGALPLPWPPNPAALAARSMARMAAQHTLRIGEKGRGPLN